MTEFDTIDFTFSRPSLTLEEMIENPLLRTETDVNDHHVTLLWKAHQLVSVNITKDGHDVLNVSPRFDEEDLHRILKEKGLPTLGS